MKRGIKTILTITLSVILLPASAWAINLTDNDIRYLSNGDYLLNWVSRINSLGRYAPDDLVSLAPLGASNESFRAIAYDDLAAMKADIESQGLNLEILSAYRSFETQKEIHAYYEKNFENADAISAEAGHSEHQLGTTIDFGAGNQTDLQQSFANTQQFQWLRNFAWQYGFALSYPENSQEVTGYIFEPWHWRHIGRSAAEQWHNAGQPVLESFLKNRVQFFGTESLLREVVKEANNPTVYYIAENGRVRPFISAEIFFSYSLNFAEVLIVTDNQINQFGAVEVMKLPDNPTVYLLRDNFTKAPFYTAQQFLNAGYNWGEIVLVNETELQAYPTVE